MADGIAPPLLESRYVVCSMAILAEYLEDKGQGVGFEPREIVPRQQRRHAVPHHLVVVVDPSHLVGEEQRQVDQLRLNRAERDGLEAEKLCSLELEIGGCLLDNGHVLDPDPKLAVLVISGLD
eukprot:CAMPEP_0196737646 /NCGR_PEP_ID=MMETSP1091-20130531/15313_1 /TAXON_ID=302021 /ORGANISM="Rhodomonas sp., Strain CCMP768" /LENGTH=122 /DNA_ID=CAMNT_0042081523 /DNA_START=69 /DNA_END=436 /DNA_ORIENTATION=+